MRVRAAWLGRNIRNQRSKLRWEKFGSNSGASASYPAEVMAWFSIEVQHEG